MRGQVAGVRDVDRSEGKSIVFVYVILSGATISEITCDPSLAFRDCIMRVRTRCREVDDSKDKALYICDAF